MALEVADICSSSGALLGQALLAAYGRHVAILQQLNLKWAAKACPAWELWGNLNSAFYHRIVCSQWHQNLISSLLDEHGSLIMEEAGPRCISSWNKRVFDLWGVLGEVS